MGDEMKQAETGMPSLTLEPDFAPEVKKEPEVQVQGQLMEVAPEMGSGPAEDGTDSTDTGRTEDGGRFCI